MSTLTIREAGPFAGVAAAGPSDDSPAVRRRTAMMVTATAAALVVWSLVWLLSPLRDSATAGSVATTGGDGALLQPPAVLVEHRVVAGDTVWGLAAELVGGQADRRPMVDRVVALNGLAGDTLLVGETVLLPAVD